MTKVIPFKQESDEDMLTAFNRWRALNYLEVSSSPDAIKHVSVLESRIEAICDWYFQIEYPFEPPRAVTLAELNRRFGRAAKALNTTISSVVQGLMQKRKLIMVSFDRSNLIYPPQKMEKYLEPYRMSPMYEQVRKEVFMISLGYPIAEQPLKD